MEIKQTKILAIDDNPDNLIVISALLGEAFPFATLIVADSGKEGIELCHIHHPDVILLDIVMPVMDGYEVCETLKNDETLKYIPIVMVTAARTDKEGRIRALEVGADGFLTKPLDISELKAQITAMLRIKESEDHKLGEKERLEKLVKERTEALLSELTERKKAENELQSSFIRLEDSKQDIVCLMLNLEKEIEERKRIELTLEETNKKYVEAQRIAHIGSWEHDFLKGELHWSEEMYKIIGFTPGSIPVYEDVIKCFPPKERIRYDKAVKDALENNITYSYDFEIIAPNGEIKYLHDEAEVIRDGNGNPILMIGTSHDITDRKLAEIRHQESFDFINSLLNTIPYAMDIVDKEGEIMFQNDNFIKCFGNEARGKKCWNIYNEEQTRNKNCPLITGIEIGQTGLCQIPDHIGGKNYEISYTGMMYNGEKALLEIFQDVTERKRSELIQNVLYAISHAVITTKNVKELSEVIKIQLGLLIDTTNFCIASYDEITGMMHVLYLADQIDKIESWPVERSLTGYVIKHNKSLLVTKHEIGQMTLRGEIDKLGTDSEIWLGVPLRDEGKVIGACVLQNYTNSKAYSAKDVELLEFVSHQISIAIQRKKSIQDVIKALEKAEESDKLKTAFLSNMSHEIRTPMNGILGFSELLDDETISNDERRKYLDIINTNCQHLLSIINDILDIARIDSNQLAVTKTPFNLHHLLEEVLVSYDKSKISYGKEHIKFILDKELQDRDCTIVSDEIRLRQILYNLLGNALKFTKAGYIKFGYSLEKGMLRFYVEDTGKGISKENHTIVFERFRQEEESYTRQFGGTGLGLSISKKLVEMLGGEIWLESVQGVGSTFYFTIPFIYSLSNKENEFDSSFMTELNLSGRIILIVDDDEDNSALFNFYLEYTNATLIFAKNGQEAVDLCKNNPDIDLILMDIQMPILNGINATHQIRQFNKRVPIIAITAYAFSGDKKYCLENGCDDFVSKPVDSEILFQKIKTFLLG